MYSVKKPTLILFAYVNSLALMIIGLALIYATLAMQMNLFDETSVRIGTFNIMRLLVQAGLSAFFISYGRKTYYKSSHKLWRSWVDRTIQKEVDFIVTSLWAFFEVLFVLVVIFRIIGH